MRIFRFVKAARSLLIMQVVAAALALALALWALLAVRDLAAERDQLLAENLRLQQGAPAAPVAAAPEMASPSGVAPSPLDSEVRPPAIMPVMIPIVTDVPVTPPLDAAVPPPAGPGTATPAPGTAGDCAGPNPDPARCRGRWSVRTPPAATPAPAPPIRIAPPADTPKN